MTALVQQVKSLDCSRKNKGCKNKATQTVTYKQIMPNEPLEKRNLCDSCFHMQDEKGLKIFQMDVTDITPIGEDANLVQ